MSDPMDGDAGLVTPEGFPHGLRCIACRDLIPNGHAYARVPLLGGNYELVCATCAIRQETP
ncbi:hypothetical protein L5G28_07580 [Gordonia sp. HY285]|uniref:hypothetical protein n=1 Tax=Gordonia liuliyuniae TaxID=2911517 RepID=UPI001F214878|nr:hypothetical protein [Gordonia liuliyuniae]MCF8610021.1 hypothetical protein [Gordonia liuliyuniae]